MRLTILEPEGNNPSGVDNFGYSPLPRAAIVYYYSSLSPFFLWHMNLSMADLRNYWTEFHETWWSYRYMILVGPKVFNIVVKGVKVIF